MVIYSRRLCQFLKELTIFQILSNEGFREHTFYVDIFYLRDLAEDSFVIPLSQP
jgi:hypothetical protein